MKFSLYEFMVADFKRENRKLSIMTWSWHQPIMTSAIHDISQSWHQPIMTSTNHDINQSWHQPIMTSANNAFSSHSHDSNNTRSTYWFYPSTFSFPQSFSIYPTHLFKHYSSFVFAFNRPTKNKTQWHWIRSVSNPDSFHQPNLMMVNWFLCWSFFEVD